MTDSNQIEIDTNNNNPIIENNNGNAKKKEPLSIVIPNSSADPNTEIPLSKNRIFFIKYGYVIIFLGFEAILILLYGLFTTFSVELNPLEAAANNAISQEHVKQYYPLYQDINVMVFIGFGFLYTYLYRNSWYSIAMTFLLTAYTVQITILLNGFFHMVVTNHYNKIEIEIRTLIAADYAVAAVLISLGGVLGRLNPFQLLIMATMEIIFYAPNLALGEAYLFAMDMGGSMYIHTFGAYFGITLSLVYSWGNTKNLKDHLKNKSGYMSNLFAFIGTAFLWLFWPSFNGAFGLGSSQQRIIVNTVLALTGSALAAFFINPLMNSHGKFKMEILLNATLAGGVAVGASCDVLGTPWSSLLIGFCGGAIAVVGFELLSPVLREKCNLYDVAGINNLHGMPGLFGSIVGVILAGNANEEILGPSLELIFPEIASGRTPAEQAQIQAAAIGLSVLFSVVGGGVTGLVLRLKCFNAPQKVDELYTDIPYFEEIEDLEKLIKDDEIEEEEFKKTHPTGTLNYDRVVKTESQI